MEIDKYKNKNTVENRLSADRSSAQPLNRRGFMLLSTCIKSYRPPWGWRNFNKMEKF